VIIPIFSFGKKNQITPINQTLLTITNIKTEETVVPNFNQRKVVLQDYLSKHNIPFQPLETKKQLYEKIKLKKLLSVFKTDKIANLHGHVLDWIQLSSSLDSSSSNSIIIGGISLLSMQFSFPYSFSIFNTWSSAFAQTSFVILNCPGKTQVSLCINVT
jgi:hypothetical protein